MDEFSDSWQVRLAAIRSTRRLTLDDIANRCGVELSELEAVEKGDLGAFSLVALRGYVSAIGGELRVMVEIDGREIRLR